MLLCDTEINLHSRRTAEYEPLIEPFNIEQLQPSSYDFRLGSRFLTIAPWTLAIDIRHPVDMVEHNIEEGQTFVLEKDGFVLGETVEYVRIPHHLAGQLEGKSSLARLGLIVHAAGFFDPGFEGIGTLEIHNISGHPWRLQPGMRICQMKFECMHAEPFKPYEGKYKGQTRVTPSRSHIKE